MGNGISLGTMWGSVRHEVGGPLEKFRCWRCEWAKRVRDAGAIANPGTESTRRRLRAGGPPYKCWQRRKRHKADGGLLVSQGDHRIDSRGTAGGDVTGRHGDSEQNDGHGAERQRIRRGDAVEQARNQAREQKR